MSKLGLRLFLSVFLGAAVIPQMLNTWHFWILTGWFLFAAFVAYAIWFVDVKEK